MMKTTFCKILGAALLISVTPVHAGQHSGGTQPQPAAAEPSFKKAVGGKKAARKAERAVERRTGKPATVTGIEREDDYGARWEVEVTLRNGREFDVYVDRKGRIVKIVRQGRDDDGGGQTGGSGVSRSEAAAAALAHIEESTGSGARVTGVSREDDHGARWEVEITRDDGFEYDVYVNRLGEVVRVKETGFDD